MFIPDRQGLPEALADHLQGEILDQVMPPGHRLPTEVELANRYGVSRTVVREAARLLVQRGLVSVRPGRGMTVVKFDGQFIAEQYALLMRTSSGTFDQLLELRLVLEVEMAALAAERHTPEVLERMRTSISANEASIGSKLEFLEHDMAFHLLVAEAGENPFFTLIARPINSLLRSTYRERSSYPSDPQSTIREHRDITDAIESSDPGRARAAAAKHLCRLPHHRSTLPSDESFVEGPSPSELNVHESAI